MFTPFALTRNVKLSHRIVMAPLTRCRATEPGYVFTPITALYYKQRSSEGGLLVAEATCINEWGRGMPNVPGIYSDDHIKMWKEVADAVHSENGYIFLQLWHVGRQSSAQFQPDGLEPYSASATALTKTPYGQPDNTIPPPRAMELKDIQKTIQDFYQASKNSRSAGLDGVEIHGANGYLIQQFLDSSVNVRTDQYGGSVENRCRFPLEVIQACIRGWLGLPIDASDADVSAAAVTQCGDSKKVEVGIRLAPYGTFGDINETDSSDIYKYLLEEIEKLPAKLCYIHMCEPRFDFMAEKLEGVASNSIEFKKYSTVPFISAVGYSYDANQAAKEIENGTAELVGFGRAFIPNPDLVNRIRNGYKLRPWDRNTFYTPGAAGYSDQPTYEQEIEGIAQAAAN